MQIILNGENIDFSGYTVADLVEQMAVQKPFALAVNTEFVAKNDYAHTQLAEQDKVDIVRPVVGG